MKYSIIKTSSYKDYHFFTYLFKHKRFFNSISQPHLRNIIYMSSKLRTMKYKPSIISEI